MLNCFKKRSLKTTLKFLSKNLVFPPFFLHFLSYGACAHVYVLVTLSLWFHLLFWTQWLFEQSPISIFFLSVQEERAGKIMLSLLRKDSKNEWNPISIVCPVEKRKSFSISLMIPPRFFFTSTSPSQFFFLPSYFLLLNFNQLLFLF